MLWDPNVPPRKNHRENPTCDVRCLGELLESQHSISFIYWLKAAKSWKTFSEALEDENMQKESKRCFKKLKYLANKMTNSTIFTIMVSNELTQIWKLEIISNTEYHANSEKRWRLIPVSGRPRNFESTNHWGVTVRVTFPASSISKPLRTSQSWYSFHQLFLQKRHILIGACKVSPTKPPYKQVPRHCHSTWLHGLCQVPCSMVG